MDKSIDIENFDRVVYNRAIDECLKRGLDSDWKQWEARRWRKAVEEGWGPMYPRNLADFHRLALQAEGVATIDFQDHLASRGPHAGGICVACRLYDSLLDEVDWMLDLCWEYEHSGLTDAEIFPLLAEFMDESIITPGHFNYTWDDGLDYDSDEYHRQFDGDDDFLVGVEENPGPMYHQDSEKGVIAKNRGNKAKKVVKTAESKYGMLLAECENSVAHYQLFAPELPVAHYEEVDILLPYLPDLWNLHRVRSMGQGIDVIHYHPMAINDMLRHVSYQSLELVCLVMGEYFDNGCSPSYSNLDPVLRSYVDGFLEQWLTYDSVKGASEFKSFKAIWLMHEVESAKREGLLPSEKVDFRPLFKFPNASYPALLDLACMCGIELDPSDEQDQAAQNRVGVRQRQGMKSQDIGDGIPVVPNPWTLTGLYPQGWDSSPVTVSAVVSQPGDHVLLINDLVHKSVEWNRAVVHALCSQVGSSAPQTTMCYLYLRPKNATILPAVSLPAPGVYGGIEYKENNMWGSFFAFSQPGMTQLVQTATTTNPTMNPGDEIHIGVAGGSSDAQVTWVVWVDLVGIEPNPGPSTILDDHYCTFTQIISGNNFVAVNLFLNNYGEQQTFSEVEAAITISPSTSSSSFSANAVIAAMPGSAAVPEPLPSGDTIWPLGTRFLAHVSIANGTGGPSAPVSVNKVRRGGLTLNDGDKIVAAYSVGSVPSTGLSFTVTLASPYSTQNVNTVRVSNALLRPKERLVGVETNPGPRMCKDKEKVDIDIPVDQNYYAVLATLEEAVKPGQGFSQERYLLMCVGTRRYISIEKQPRGRKSYSRVFDHFATLMNKDTPIAGRHGGERSNQKGESKFVPLTQKTDEAKASVVSVIEKNVRTDPCGILGSAVIHSKVLEMVIEACRLDSASVPRTPRGMVVKWLGEGYLCGADLRDDMSKDKALNFHLSRDSIRIADSPLGPDGYGEFLQASANQRKHSETGNGDSPAVQIIMGGNVTTETRVLETTPSDEGPVTNVGGGILMGEVINAVPRQADEIDDSHVTESGPLGDIGAAIGRVLDNPGEMFITPTNSIQDMLRTWAQVQQLRPSRFNSTGRNAFTGINFSYLGQIFATTPGPNSVMAQVWHIIDPSAALNIAAGLSKVGSALLTAIQQGDSVLISQIIRISTSVVKGDALQQAMIDGINKYVSGLVGSFIAPILRLILYVYMMCPMVGPENATFLANSHMQLDEPLDYESTVPPVFWPLAPENTQVEPQVMAKICTYVEFTAYRLGTLADWDDDYSSDKWGNSVAVIPLLSDAVNRSLNNGWWTLAHLEYPFVQFGFTYSEMHDDMTPSRSNQGIRVLGACCNVRVRGPVLRVLYVIANITMDPRGMVFSVGAEAAITDVSYPQNSPLGGAAIDIAPAILACMATESRMLGAMNAMQYWQQLYGNGEDIRTAYILAADACHLIGPTPLKIGNTGQIFGAFFSDVAPGLWNGGAFIGITQADLDITVAAATSPFSMWRVPNIADVRELRGPFVTIGIQDPIASVDMAAGLILPKYSRTVPIPQTTGAICNMIRQLVEPMGAFMDIILRDTKIPMDQMFRPNDGQGGAPTQVMNTELWFNVYQDINDFLRYSINAPMALWQPNVMVNTTVQHWQRMGAGYAVATARVPIWNLLQFGIGNPEWWPTDYTVKKLTPYMTARGYPTPGDGFEMVLTKPPQFGSDQDFMRISALTSVFPPDNAGSAGRYEVQTILATQQGTYIYQIGWPVRIPSQSRSIAIVLLNYGIINPGKADFVEPQLYSSIPNFNIFVSNDVYLGFWGNMFGYFTRVDQKVYNMNLPILGSASADWSIDTSSMTENWAASMNRTGRRFRNKSGGK